MNSVYSIRESLQGSLQTFVRDSGLDSTFVEDLVRDLVVSLSSYREEDVPLFPAVFVGLTEEDLSSILKTGQPVRIGQTNRKSSPAATILKDCAPLAKGGWAIFVYVDGTDTLNYGVFRSARHSLSTGADEVIADLGASVRLLMLRNCGHQSVEMYNTSQHRMTAVLKVTNSTHSALDKHIAAFVTAATARIEDSFELQAYLRRVLTGIIQHCHGTLLAVIPSYKGDHPPLVKAGVVPEPGLDFGRLHSEAMNLKDADSLSDISAAEVLLEGMIGSDGIVVFGDDATVRAYRSFVKAEPSEEHKVGSDGGARRRAFAVLKLRLETGYLAAFYRSQDGETKCEVAK